MIVDGIDEPGVTPLTHPTDPGEMPRGVLEHELDCAWQIVEEHRRTSTRAMIRHRHKCEELYLEHPLAHEFRRISDVVDNWDHYRISGEAAMLEIRKLVECGNLTVARRKAELDEKKARS